MQYGKGFKLGREETNGTEYTDSLEGGTIQHLTEWSRENFHHSDTATKRKSFRLTPCCRTTSGRHQAKDCQLANLSYHLQPAPSLQQRFNTCHADIVVGSQQFRLFNADLVKTTAKNHLPTRLRGELIQWSCREKLFPTAERHALKNPKSINEGSYWRAFWNLPLKTRLTKNKETWMPYTNYSHTDAFHTASKV